MTSHPNFIDTHADAGQCPVTYPGLSMTQASTVSDYILIYKKTFWLFLFRIPLLKMLASTPDFHTCIKNSMVTFYKFHEGEIL